MTMKKRIKALAAVTVLFIALTSACGQNNGAEPAKEPVDSGIATDDQLQTPPAEPAEQPSEEPAAEPTPSTDAETPDADAPQQPPVEQEVEKSYHMNKAFFIKPNDENGNKKVVLLTFDDGPKEKEMLTSILDTLDNHGAKAIFFVNGFRVKQHPELLKLIDERGQIVGNHSYDHIILKKESNEKIDQQLGDVQTIVKETIGKAPQFFRPPNGAGNDYIRAKAKELGMLYMTWSNGSLDWADNQKNPEGVIKSVMDQLAPGSNILMHELPWTAEALDKLLTQLEDAGYSFVDPRAIELEAR